VVVIAIVIEIFGAFCFSMGIVFFPQAPFQAVHIHVIHFKFGLFTFEIRRAMNLKVMNREICDCAMLFCFPQSSFCNDNELCARCAAQDNRNSSCNSCTISRYIELLSDQTSPGKLEYYTA